MVFLNHVSHAYDFPARTAPLWAPAVERWPQLDAYAYGLPELFQHAQPLARPDIVLLASPEASNRTDLSFVRTGALSPAKFVHTLPNSRSAALLQVMAWSGTLLCLQDDPHTLGSALSEGASMVLQEKKRVWIFSVERRDEQVFIAHLFDIFSQTSARELSNTHWQLEKTSTGESAALGDRELFAALQNPGVSRKFMVFNDLQMTLKDLARG